jgi:hypothetical protein
MDVKETGCEGVDWIQMTQDRDQWRDLLNMEAKLRVPSKTGIFLIS